MLWVILVEVVADNYGGTNSVSGLNEELGALNGEIDPRNARRGWTAEMTIAQSKCTRGKSRTVARTFQSVGDDPRRPSHANRSAGALRNGLRSFHSGRLAGRGIPYRWLWVLLYLLANSVGHLHATATETEAKAETETETEAETPAEVKTSGQPPADWPIPANWKKLSREDQCWIDAEQKQVIVGGKVCLTRGVLEMFACPQHTKEHESIIAVDCRAQVAHTALLAVGAEAGHPVRYEPKYEAATGTVVDIDVVWRDDQGKQQRRRAQEMIRNAKTDKGLEQSWVFAGSLFWEDPTTQKRYYQAEGGEFICVSNFGNAMLDLPIQSSDTNDSLLFKAFTENIPPMNTDVRLILTPHRATVVPPKKKE
ncbi:MAG: YdjY domain-containing protein [Planctomycetota bacterium]|nr:YdjY domain-containing protein [Planctomycetota bacterium]MDA1179557.1 YdjY domain-containing protein [Planctomycetota bacterium]